jgi:hypothetical protein
VLEAKFRYCNWENFINRFSDKQATHAIEALAAGPKLTRERKKRGNKVPKQEAEEAEQEAPSARKSWI